MAINTPIKLSPANTTIDPSINNTFSYIARGSPQTHHQIIVRNNDTSAIIYDSTKLATTDQFFIIPASTFTANISLKWQVSVWCNSDTASSQYAFLNVHNAPTLTFIAPNFSSPPVVLTGQNYLFQMLFTQAQNVSLSKYRVVLYDSTGINIIDDSGYIYGFTPEYQFTGMLRGESYKVIGYAVAQDGLLCDTGMKDLSIATYTIPNTVPAIVVTPNNCSASIDVSWADLKLVIPVVDGDYSYVSGKFNLGVLLEYASSLDYQELVYGSSNNLTGWYKFMYALNYEFINLGSDIAIGFDNTLQKFYISTGGGADFTYSPITTVYTWDDFGSDDWSTYTGTWQNPGFTSTDLTSAWFRISVNNSNQVVAYLNDKFIFNISNTDVVADYNSIKITGKMLVDNVNAQNTSLTLSEMNNIPFTSAQLWQVKTNWLANYENTLEAGNINNAVSITGWRLKRRRPQDSIFETIGDFSKTTRDYIDHTVINNQEYIYAVYSLSSNGEGLGLEGQATVNFFGWYVVDITSGEWFKFDAGFGGIKTDDVAMTINKYVYSNFSQFPVVSKGLQRWRSSKITAVPYVFDSILNTFTVDEVIYKQVETLLNNKKMKILKNSSGQLIYVDTTLTGYKYEDPIGLMPYSISFDWIEISSGSGV